MKIERKCSFQKQEKGARSKKGQASFSLSAVHRKRCLSLSSQVEFDLMATPLGLLMGLTGFAPQGAAQFEIGFAQIHMKTAYPLSRDHAARAIKKGWPTLLTVDRPGAAQRGEDSRDNSGLPLDSSKGDRDEYPQAIFKENGGHADVKYVPSSDNKASGANIKAQLAGTGLGLGCSLNAGPDLFDDGSYIEMVLDY